MELTKVTGKAPAFLKKAGLVTTEEFTGGLAQGMPYMVLSVRGKAFRVRKDGHEMPLQKTELPIVLVAARKTLSKRYFDQSYSGVAETVAPVCSSVDGVTPNVPNPVAANCSKCGNNAWGSRITPSGKKGRICSDYKRLVVWIVGTDEPCILDLPATSIKAPKADRGKGYMMFADYIGQLAKHQMDPTTVVTTIGFTDAEYPQLWMNFERWVSEDEFKRVQEFRAAPETEEVLGFLEEEGGTKIEEAAGVEPVEPKPEPEPEEPPPATPEDEQEVLNELRKLLAG